MSFLAMPGPAVYALKALGFAVESAIRDRDLRRTSLVSQAAGTEVYVSAFESEPNFFDVSHVTGITCGTCGHELALRRAVDVLMQDHPFVKAAVDVLGDEARLTISVVHQLSGGEEERRATASMLVTALLAALEDLGGVNVACIPEAA